MQLAMLLALFIAALLSPRQPGTAAAVVKPPDCKQECGGVNITYPFGIGRGCYFETGDDEEPFSVTCSDRDDDDNPRPRPIPLIGDQQVLDINVTGGKIRVYSKMNWRCYQSPSKPPVDNIWEFESATFRVSDTDNMLTVVGCNVLAYIGTQENGVENRFVAGCNASCPCGVPPSTSSPCNGVDGCCQTTIQKGIRSFYPSFADDDSVASAPCRYAFLVAKDQFRFRTSYLTNRELEGAAGEKLPLVLDWAVGNKSCEVAQQNKATYACRSANHQCVNSANGPGYLCECKKGYRGNPYRENGCEYVDICKEMKPCHASAKCNNTGWGHECVCPHGRRRLLKDDGSVKCEIDHFLPAIGTSVGVVVLAVVMSCTYAIQEKKRLAAIKKSYFRQHGGLLLFEELKSRQGQGHSFTLFTNKELEQATDKFDERHVLGKGGNGTVYRGDLKDGRAVAIKRCRVAADERQRREFGKEVLILSQVNHRNIVKLYGCCLEVEVPMLVYQFIPNGTLYQLLHLPDHGAGAPRPPPFALRLKIAREAAEALAYLHSTASPSIIHGDVKSANILLDESFAAKVSDFGASVLAPSDEAHLVTLVQGTCGYLDPEYMQTCRLTDKSDVYSFGVVLLELLTRRKALALAAPEEERSLAAHFLSAMRDGKLGELLDASIAGEASGEVLEMVAALAKRCLEMSGEKRPSMREVAEELDTIRKIWRQGGFGEVVVLVSDR